MSDSQFPTRVLTEYPANYPQHLVAETQLIIAEAVKTFPTLDLIVPLCQYVIARMTLVMMRESSGVRPDLAFMHMGNLVECILIDHFPHNFNLRFGLKQEILKSDDWQALAKAVRDKSLAPKPEKPHQEPAPAPSVAASAPEQIQVNNSAAVYVFAQEARRAKKRKRKVEPQTKKPPAPVTASPELCRSERVVSFLRGLRKVLGRKFNRDEFCMVADVDSSEFRRWQRNDPETSGPAAKRIENVLGMKPDEFHRELNSPR